MVLPNIEPGQGAKLSHSISLIPAILVLISRIYKESEEGSKTLISLDLISILLQLFCSIGWSVILYYDDQSTLNRISQVWIIPFILIFISLGFWENYLNIKKLKHLNKFLVYLCQIKKEVDKSRYFTYALISFWKIILTFVTILIYYTIIDWTEDKNVVNRLFYHFDDAFSKHKINISRASIAFTEELPEIYSKPFTYLWVILIQFISTLLCYALSKFVCKIQIQVFSFTFPLTIVGPMTIVLVNLMCRLRHKYTCQLTQLLAVDYIYWNSPTIETNDKLSANDFIESILWILSLISQIWITFHIWEPKSERLAKTENLFSKPEFNCVFIDQSLILNRKILSEKTKVRKMSREELQQREKEMVRIYMCATMWHENRDEMAQMLKSIFRMDIDQSCRRQAKMYLNVTSDDYYECESIATNCE